MSFFLEYLSLLDDCDFSKEWWSNIFKNHYQYSNFQRYITIVSEMGEIKRKIKEIKQKYVETTNKLNDETTKMDDFVRIKISDEKARLEKEIRRNGNEYVEKDRQKNELVTLYPMFASFEPLDKNGEEKLVEKWKCLFENEKYCFDCFDCLDGVEGYVDLCLFLKEKCEQELIVKKETVKEEQPQIVIVNEDMSFSTSQNDIFYFMNSFMWGHFMWYLMMYVPWGNLVFDFCGVMLFLLWCQNVSKQINIDIGNTFGGGGLVVNSEGRGGVLRIIKMDENKFMEMYMNGLYKSYVFVVDVSNNMLNGTYFSELTVVVGGLFMLKMVYPYFNFNNVLWMLCQMVSFQSIPDFNKRGLVSVLKTVKNLNLELKRIIDTYVKK